MILDDKQIFKPLEPTAPVQKRETVGDYLKNARVKKGIDISRISEYLRIKPQYLRAIEDGKFSALPGAAYAVGFIRSYAGYLDLDPAKAVELFKGDSDVAPVVKEFETSEENELIEDPIINSNHIIIAGVAVVIAILAAILFKHSASRPRAIAPEPVPVVKEAIEEEEITDAQPFAAEVDFEALRQQLGRGTTPARTYEPAAPAPDPVIAPAPTPVLESVIITEKVDVAEAATIVRTPIEYGRANAANSRITLRATGRTWVKLKEGFYKFDEESRSDVGPGRTVFFNTLLEGDTFHVPAAEGLFLSVGDVHALDIVADGQVIPVILPNARSRVRANIEMNVDRLNAGTAWIPGRVIEVGTEE